jgi:hypothetical protein
MRKSYLQEHRPGLYNHLALLEKLQAHLAETDQTAYQRLELIMPELAKAAKATKEPKAVEPLKWVGLMNTCKAQAEEIILGELILCIKVQKATPSLGVALLSFYHPDYADIKKYAFSILAYYFIDSTAFHASAAFLQ